jgi:hypothetical protein
LKDEIDRKILIKKPAKAIKRMEIKFDKIKGGCTLMKK